MEKERRKGGKGRQGGRRVLMPDGGTEDTPCYIYIYKYINIGIERSVPNEMKWNDIQLEAFVPVFLER